MLERIEREMVLPAPPEEVWDIITGPGWLAEFLLGPRRRIRRLPGWI